MDNILTVKDRSAFREWLAAHPDAEECWVTVKRGRPADPAAFYYLDAVEEALCFGWIDSTTRKIGEIRYQRFSPRQKNSPWTELNKERARRLQRLGWMTDRGRAVLPPLESEHFSFDPEVVKALKTAEAWEQFQAFPPLYQRIRAYNTAFYRKRNPAAYDRSLAHLIRETKAGRMYGEWNDYGRLLED